MKYLLGVVWKEDDINFFKIAKGKPCGNVFTTLCVISEFERYGWISDENLLHHPRMHSLLEHAAPGKNQFKFQVD